PRRTGQSVYRAVLPRPAQQTTGGFFFGPRNKVASNLVSDEEAYYACVVNGVLDPRPDRDRWPGLMREQLADHAEPVLAARDRIGPGTPVDYRPLSTLLLTPPWHRGRVVLVGDAAHTATPHLSSGASLALEDALVLVEELQRASTVEDGLTAYAHRRFGRCRAVVDASVQLGEWELHPDPGADVLGLIMATEDLLAQEP
ncbi:FAD-dependent monooxygenase, partial [Dactylosporangium sp. NPDC051541]|uniref:FAD-dependent monooxygenase n=1 Tax=Dactylosporangium sp. NPDC051541 TaxID=3363977 RepID=UPI0037BE0B1C